MSFPIETQAEKTLGQQTIEKVRSALDGGHLPNLTQVLEIVRELAAKVDSITVSDLASIIGRDPATINKLIGIANNLGYNPEGIEITTISQAIHSVGFDRIRNLAISLLLMEGGQAAGASQSDEVATTALASALTAEVISARRRPGLADEAFVCAALRNYGKMLMCQVLSDGYAEALKLVGELGAEQAFHQVLGITPLDLGRELLMSAQLPETLMETLRKVPPELIQAKTASPNGELILLSEFSVQFCEMVDAPDFNPKQLKGQALVLAKSFGDALPLNEIDFETLVTEVSQKLSSILRGPETACGKTRIAQKLRSLGSGEPWPDKKKPVRAVEVQDQFVKLLKELDAMLRSPGTPAKEISGMGIRGLKLLLPSAEVVFFGIESEGGGFSVRNGFGKLFESIRGRPMLTQGQRDVFSVSLTRGEDVVIDDPTDARIQPFIPAWLKSTVRPFPFVTMPLRKSGTTMGLICCILTEPTDIGRQSKLFLQLASLRDRMAAGTAWK